MQFTTISVSPVEPIVQITLTRPDVHNAFNETLISELTETITRLSVEPTVRAIVLGGEGKSFCAGADLDWMRRMAAYTSEQNFQDALLLARLFEALAACPKVTIAKVHGAAIGGGAGLVAVCDIAIASQTAVFALSEVRLGLIPAIVGPYVLEKVGMSAARSLFVTGERFGAGEALRIGLVNQVVAADELDSAIDAKCQLVLKGGPHAIATAKSLLRTISRTAPAELSELTARCIADLRSSPEGQEGIAAFLEKRDPRF